MSKFRTSTVENYLKTIYNINTSGKEASTNEIASKVDAKAASVTDMIKKLSDEGLVNYEKYKGVSLTTKGSEIALNIIRKHRLWEVFLVEKMNFDWSEVHDIAEQLEHIKSVELTSRLDKFLGYPKVDPHGDPIPDENGALRVENHSVSIIDLEEGNQGVIVGVKDSSSDFLNFLAEQNLTLGREFKVLKCYGFDSSMLIETKDGKFQLSEHSSKNIFVKKN